MRRRRFRGTEGTIGDPEAGFPPRVEVPTSFIRDHERLKLEAEHLEERGEDVIYSKEIE